MKFLKPGKFNWVLMTLVGLSLCFFVVEKWQLSQNRLDSLLSNYTSLKVSEINEFHHKVGAEIEGDAWNKYFFTRISKRMMKRIIKKHPQVDGIAFLDQFGSVLANTFSIDKTGLMRYTKRARKSRAYVQFISNHGFQRLYPVFSLEDTLIGYVIFRWTMAGNAMKDTLLFASLRQNKMFTIPRAAFSNEEAKNLKRSLLRLVSDSSNGSANIEVHKSSIAVHWQYWKAYGMYVALIGEESALFSLASFYALSFSVLTLLIVSFMQKPKIWEKISHERVKESLKCAINQHNDALESLKSELSDIKSAYKTSKYFTESEKVVRGTIIDDYVPAKSNEVGDDVFTIDTKQADDDSFIELKPLKREFVLIDPTDSSWRSQEVEVTEDLEREAEDLEKENTAIEKAREKAFNPEVIQLIQDIAEPRDTTDLIKKIEVFEKMYKTIEIPSYRTHLNEVYFDEVTIDEVKNVLSLLSKDLSANGVALMKYNPYLGCYETIIAAGISETIKDTLYLINEDPVVPLAPHLVSFKSYSEEEKQDKFFKKRFDDETIDFLKSIGTISLHDYFLNAFIVVFYDRDLSEKEFTDLYEIQTRKNLVQMVPALKFFFMEQAGFNINDQNVELIKELKLVTRYGKEAVDIVQMIPSETTDLETFTELSARLSGQIEPDERLIYSSPNRIVLILRTTKLSDLRAILDLHFPDFEYHVDRFPDKGKSFYLYL